jgi:DNA excision repair protein ERCC-6
MAASRKLKSILIISPATMLQHWLQELAKWAPGIRRFLIHSSADSQQSRLVTRRSSSNSSTVTSQLLAAVDDWLKRSRQNRLFEIIDEDDLTTRDPASFCGTGYAFVTTFENIRRNEEVWTRHKWNYVVMDEAQKIRNPAADITLVCKVRKTEKKRLQSPVLSRYCQLNIMLMITTTHDGDKKTCLKLSQHLPNSPKMRKMSIFLFLKQLGYNNSG